MVEESPLPAIHHPPMAALSREGGGNGSRCLHEWWGGFHVCLLLLLGIPHTSGGNASRILVINSGQLLGCWVAGGFGIVERQLIHFVFVIFHGYLMLYFIISVVKHIRGNYGPAVGRTSNVGRVY